MTIRSRVVGDDFHVAVGKEGFVLALGRVRLDVLPFRVVVAHVIVDGVIVVHNFLLFLRTTMNMLKNKQLEEFTTSYSGWSYVLVS